jgi:predicted GTPase
MSDSSKINVLLIGATGVGKSSTGNSLLGREAFVVGATSDPTTTNNSLIEGTEVCVTDTPGVDNIVDDNVRIQKELRYAVESDTDGFDVIVLVFK